MNAYERICLVIPEEIERLMKERGIKSEDLQKALYHAETTGESFVSTSTGRSLTSHRPGRVTYWVEYSKVGEEVHVHSAYSHRMEMKRGRGS